MKAVTEMGPLGRGVDVLPLGDGATGRDARRGAPTGIPSPLPALRPEDYYFDRSLMVFSEAYHLRRGYCCGNNCRHCPYLIVK
jgi:Family of unknown function (DUF5522)